MIVNEYINNQLQTLMANHTRYVIRTGYYFRFIDFFSTSENGPAGVADETSQVDLYSIMGIYVLVINTGLG